MISEPFSIMVILIVFSHCITNSCYSIGNFQLLLSAKLLFFLHQAEFRHRYLRLLLHDQVFSSFWRRRSSNKSSNRFFIIFPRFNKVRSINSAVPPISPIKTIPSVSGSSKNNSSASTKFVPFTGSPPIPIIVQDQVQRFELLIHKIKFQILRLRDQFFQVYRYDLE